MTARRTPAAHLCLRVGSRHEVAFVPFPARAPMFVIGAAGTLVSFTLPEQIEAGHVDFARQLAAQAWAYAVAVERRYRGLPPLPDIPVPYTLTAQAEALLEAGSVGADLVPLPADLDELLRELDEEITKAGVRGKVAPTRPARRHRSTRRRQDAPDLPSRKVSPRTVGKTYTAPDGKTFRPSMFITSPACPTAGLTIEACPWTRPELPVWHD